MKEQLEKIFANATEDLAKATSINDIEEIRGKYLSRKGEFNEIKKNLKNLGRRRGLMTSQMPQGAKKPACSARGLLFARILSDLT